MGIFSTDEAWDCYQSGIETKADRWDALVRIGWSGFRPCPICGRALTTDDMVFCDDEGPMEEIFDAHNGDGTFDREVLGYKGWADAVENIGIQCPCGFAFWAPADGIRMEKGRAWLKEFKEKANRRFGV